VNEIQFHVPPRNQGQIVEVAYAAVDDHVIQRVYDASDRTTEFYVSKMLVDDQGDYWNGEPANKRWRRIKGQELRRFGLDS
jgi:hypothetical protein